MAQQAGLHWNGRWGSWCDSGVVVLATSIGLIELHLATPRGGDAEVLFQAALEELRSELEAGVAADPGSGLVLATLHWVEDSRELLQKRRRLRAAFLGDAAPCRKLQEAWKQRTLCGGAIIAIWALTFDSASRKHCEGVSAFLKGGSRGQCRAVTLSLPGRWMSKNMKVTQMQSPGAHWYDFACVFGRVESAELISMAEGRLGPAHLLVQFSDNAGACAMCEALTDRYLYNPSNKKQDDCHPASCTIGDHGALRDCLVQGRPPSTAGPGGLEAKAEMRSLDIPPTAVPETLTIPPGVKVPVVTSVAALSAAAAVLPAAAVHSRPPVPMFKGPFAKEPTASESSVFSLRRCGLQQPEGAWRPLPDMIELSATRPRLVIGREDHCDVVIGTAYVSKCHAHLVLQDSLDGVGWMLMVKDTSSNGTWLNSLRMVPNQFVQLRASDKLSLMPPVANLDTDPLTYVVVEGMGAAAPLPDGAKTPALPYGMTPVPPPRSAPHSPSPRRRRSPSPPVPPTSAPLPMSVPPRGWPDASEAGRAADGGASDGDGIAAAPPRPSAAAPPLPAPRTPPRMPLGMRRADGMTRVIVMPTTSKARGQPPSQPWPRSSGQRSSPEWSRKPAADDSLDPQELELKRSMDEWAAIGSKGEHRDEAPPWDDESECRQDRGTSPAKRQRQSSAPTGMPRSRPPALLAAARPPPVLAAPVMPPPEVETPRPDEEGPGRHGSSAAAPPPLPPRSPAVLAAPAPPPPEAEDAGCTLDISEWLDVLGLPQYKADLNAQFDSVSQITRLYSPSIIDFFEDCGIDNEEHRFIFSTAICK